MIVRMRTLLSIVTISAGCSAADGTADSKGDNGQNVSSALSLPSLTDIVCTTAKLNPGYWAAVAAVVGARDSGLLKSKDDCLNAGDFLGDVGIPTGVAKNCVCDEVSWPVAPPPKPTCPEPHSVCTQGSPLYADMPMGSCVNSADSNVAVAVCNNDSYCCNYLWDDACVAEVRNVFWTSVDQARSQLNPTLTCDVLNSRAAEIESQAGMIGAAVSCVGPRGFSTGPICEARSGRGHF